MVRQTTKSSVEPPMTGGRPYHQPTTPSSPPPQSRANDHGMMNSGVWSPTLQPPSQKKTNSSSRSNSLFRRVRSIFRSFPIISPAACRIPAASNKLHDGHAHGTRVTGTLYGHRKARINLVFQETPRCLPLLLLELAIPTGKLLQDMGVGLVRIALECEKHPSEKTKLIDEPIWSLYCNGRKSGYGIKREPTEEDLSAMRLLQAVSMGAGVLPSESAELPDGDLTYMRAYFERVVGSRDSETYYMVNPDGNSGPELSIFFVRV
ncbi:hypothetical protein Dimus_009104 [Dionaea muscipula]